MKAYRYNSEDKKYEGEETCQIDQLESEKAGKKIYLLPADCTYEVPPEAKEGFKIKWTGKAWEYEEEKKEEEHAPYVPTEEDLQNRKRWERNAELEKVMARVQRYQTQKEAGLATTDDNKTYSALLLYAQYLRDFPQQDGEWWNAPILTFEEWGAEQ